MTIRRVILWVTAALGLYVGAWAAGIPQSFYDSFPGLGFIWISVDGPYNEHLIRDVGSLYLALVGCRHRGDVLAYRGCRTRGGCRLGRVRHPAFPSTTQRISATCPSPTSSATPSASGRVCCWASP